MPIHLYLEYYQSNSVQRRKELDFCLMQNLNNTLVDKVFVFCNTFPDIKSPKIRILKTTNRLTFGTFFRTINKSQNDVINILCNSDIYFNETIDLVHNISENEVFALSRYDIVNQVKVPFHRVDSQDAWVFRGSCKYQFVQEEDFALGIPGCDNRIAYLLHSAGYNLRNPCSKIEALHLHESNVRSYKNTDGNNNSIILPPYHLINPE